VLYREVHTNAPIQTLVARGEQKPSTSAAAAVPATASETYDTGNAALLSGGMDSGDVTGDYPYGVGQNTGGDYS